MASCLTKSGFEGGGLESCGGSALIGGRCWVFVGGSGSAPEDIMLERDIGSALTGGGACLFLLSDTKR